MASKKNRVQLLQQKAEDKYVTELFKLKIEDGKLEELPYKIHDEIKSLLKEYNDYIGTDGKFGSSKYPHCFVTINPDLKYDDKPDEFIELITRVLSKKWVKNAIYVFEQRSIEKDKWYGLHCHMLIERRHKRETEFKREIRSTLKHIGDIKNEHILNFSFRPTKEVEKTIAYMMGEKDEQKMLKVPQDELMREELEMEAFYCKGFLYDPDYESNSSDEEKEIIPIPKKEPPKELTERIVKSSRKMTKPINKEDEDAEVIETD